jgi:two-component system, cell cycle sensor histidine kinase and response regulator CckA
VGENRKHNPFADPLDAPGRTGRLEQAERSLQESEAWQHAIIDTLPDPVIAYDLAGNLLFVSRQAAALYGVETLDEILADVKNIGSLLVEEDRARAFANFEKTLRVGHSENTQYRIRRKDGSELTIEVHSSVLRHSDGSPRGFVSVIRDIEDRLRAERARWESEANLQAILGSTEDIIASYDAEGRLLTFNRACRDAFLRHSGVELRRGMHTYDLFAEAQRPFWLANNARALAGESFSTAFSISWPDDRTRIYEAFFNPIRRDGDVVGFSTFTRDITERRRADKALRDSEERFRGIVENLDDLFFITDDQGAIMYVSPAAERVLGWRPDELIERRFADFLPEDQVPVAVEQFRRCIESGERIVDFAVAMRRADGSICQGEVKASIRTDGGRVVGTIGLIRDISERAKAEQERQKLQEQLQQAMKMEAVGRLAGGVAHDFNNLLTVIRSNAELSLMDLTPNDPLSRSFGEIVKASESASSLTGQLLAFSRKQLIEPKLVDLNELISAMHKMLVRLIGEDLVLHTLPGKELGVVKIDLGQIEQILVNLAINARDAMPEGGQLTIETANVEIDEEYCRAHTDPRPGQYVMLAVSDTGQGMTDEVKTHLFEPFFTTKEKGKGTGLGLATIYGTVKQAGGNVEVYSELGKGTTFKIYLPRVDEKADRLKKEARLSEQPGGSETILLVEDEEMVRHLAVRILHRLGYHVLDAGSAGDALLLAEQHAASIHLLFTDVVMPGMNGRQLSDRIAAIHPETKVLYSSGYTENAVAHHGVIDQGLNFIGKPYTPHALARAIRGALGG